MDILNLLVLIAISPALWRVDSGGGCKEPGAVCLDQGLLVAVLADAAEEGFAGQAQQPKLTGGAWLEFYSDRRV